MRRFRLHAFGLIMYLVLVLLKVALVNFTLNEYMMTMMMKTELRWLRRATAAVPAAITPAAAHEKHKSR